MDGDDIVRIVVLLGCLALLFPAIPRLLKERAPMLRHVVYWIALGAVLWIGYDFFIAR